MTERFEQAARKVEESIRWYRQIPAGIVAGLVFAVVLIAVVALLGYADVGPVARLEQDAVSSMVDAASWLCTVRSATMEMS